ncbi:MAG: nuclear transport factor 2 family protein [Sphingomonas sp.]|uniref:nuclear transport factor 2 family protein n=1 Tax=Sphingomonas sp. TaxID=28214 RepID=UPI003F800653
MIVLPLLLAAAAPAADRGPVPPSPADAAAVMAPLKAWFAGIDATDAAAIRNQIRIDGGGGATVAVSRPDGGKLIRHISWEDYLSKIKPGEHRYHEQFTGNPLIRIDGDIAMVWGDFTLSVDGKVATCGVDHFDLVRENGAWKVQNVSWSQRTTGCPSA